MHRKYRCSREYDQKAIPQMKRDTCIRVSTPQQLSLVHRHLSRKTQPPGMQFSKWDSISPNDQDFFYCPRWKKVRTSLTKKRNTAGLLDTVMGKTKRQKSHKDFIFFKSVLPKYSILKWYEDYRISQLLTATQSHWSIMTIANRTIKYLPFQQQLMRNRPNTLTDYDKGSWDLSVHLQRASKCLWL